MTSLDSEINGIREITNTAEEGAHVGLQAGEIRDSQIQVWSHVHNTTEYHSTQQAAPDILYQEGLNYLRDGVPDLARERLDQAVARGYDRPEVRFHRVLALLSKRSIRDLTTDERRRLHGDADAIRHREFDEWAHALLAVDRLVSDVEDHDIDAADAMRAVEQLPDLQRVPVLRHLDLVITGALKDAVWSEMCREAQGDRLDHDRVKRAWTYFEPEPAPARALKPEEPNIRVRDDISTWAGAGTALAVFALLVMLSTRAAGISAVSLGIVTVLISTWTIRAGYHATHTVSRRHIAQRIPQRARRRTSEDLGPFGNSVSEIIGKYSRRVCSPGSISQTYTSDMGDFGAILVDEIVFLYGSDHTSADRVRWLIDHLFSQREDRRRIHEIHAVAAGRVPAIQILTCIVGTAGVIASVTVLSSFAATVQPVIAAVCVASLAFALWVAIPTGFHSWVLHFGLASARADYRETLAEREAARRKWIVTLAHRRPTETEMETWLRSDRVLILDRALRQYRTPWRDVISHSFLLTPAESYRRARDPNGPWRYSLYDVRIFLITRDGVREVITQLRFRDGFIGDQARRNYRFDAVSSVHVRDQGHRGHTLEMSLNNGEPSVVRIVDPDGTDVSPDPQGDDVIGPVERPEGRPESELEATGFIHTLRILEGIAAEGKGWLMREMGTPTGNIQQHHVVALRGHSSEAADQ